MLTHCTGDDVIKE